MYPGGELASTEVLEYITDTDSKYGSTVAACNTQFDIHADLLSNILTTSVFTGGKCPGAYNGDINNTWDAGDALPVAGSMLNKHWYGYPDSLTTSTNDKTWQIAPSGRLPKDVIKLGTSDEGWRDIGGNLTEDAVLTVSDQFTGKFANRFRGIGNGSQHSDLDNLDIDGTGVLRIERGQAKSGLVGFRCQYYK
ncbi:unnamed protein product [Sphagnum jensenii]